MDVMKEKILNAYQPPEHFAEVEKLPPIVQGAADDKTELWLIRISANEVGPADLLENKVKLNVDIQDGIIGHFFNSQGEEYNIVKQGRIETLQPYAIIPNGPNPLLVKKIACQVGFVKSLQAKTSNEDNSHHGSRDVSVLGHEQKSSGLTSEKEQGGAFLDVEKPSKKKRRRSEASEQK